MSSSLNGRPRGRSVSHALCAPFKTADLWHRHRRRRSAASARQLLGHSLEAGLAAGANLNVATLNLHVASTAVEHDAVGRADDDVGGRALQVDGFLGRQREGIALRFGAHIAAGGVQLHAHVLHSALGVFGLAPGEQADAILHGPGLVALGQQVNVLACGQGGVLAGAQHRVGGGQRGNVACRTQHQVRPLGHRDAAVAAINGLAFAGAGRAAAFMAITPATTLLGGAQALQRSLQGCVRGQLVGLGFTGQLGQMGLGVAVQGIEQFGVRAQLRLRLARLHGLALA